MARRIDDDLVTLVGREGGTSAVWDRLAVQLGHAMVDEASRDDEDELTVAVLLDALGEENAYAALAAVPALPAVVGAVRLSGWYLDRLSEDAEFVHAADRVRWQGGLGLADHPRDTEQALMRVAAIGTHALDDGDLRGAARASVRVFELVLAVYEQLDHEDADALRQWAAHARGLPVAEAIGELRDLEVLREDAEPWWHLTERPAFDLAASTGGMHQSRIDTVHGVRVARGAMSNGSVFIGIEDQRPTARAGQVLHLEVGPGREPLLALLVAGGKFGTVTSELTTVASGGLPEIWISPRLTEHPDDLSDADLDAVPRSVAASALRVKEAWMELARSTEPTHPLRERVRVGLVQP